MRQVLMDATRCRRRKGVVGRQRAWQAAAHVSINYKKTSLSKPGARIARLRCIPCMQAAQLETIGITINIRELHKPYLL